MKIDQDLIEKYHLGQCTSEEAEAVETWLFSGDSDEALQLPLEESKSAHKASIWSEISKGLPAEEPVTPIKNISGRNSFWMGAAASLLLIFIALAVYQVFRKHALPENQMVSIDNKSSMEVRHVQDPHYDLSIGGKTSAQIDKTTGFVDLSGSMLISPKEDVKLHFQGRSEGIILKKGQTYIILKGHEGDDKIIIVSEKNLMDLPPLIQKQVINEFKI